MKKVLAIVLVLVLVMASAATVFADEDRDDGNLTTPVIIPVEITFNTEANTPEVYSVNIKWDSMAFVYTKTTTNNWNAEGEGPHYGLTSTTSGSYNKNSADITITNHSNAGINFTAALAGDIDAYLTLSKTSGSILSDAVGAAEDPCPFDKITVSTKATEPSANVNGTITVTISE